MQAVKSVLVVLLAAGVMAQTASAQGPSQATWSGTVFAGPSKAIGISGNDLDWGYVAGASADYRFADSRLGVRVNGLYSSYPVRTITAGVADPKFTDEGLDVDLVSWASSEGGSDLKTSVTIGPSMSRLTSTGTAAGITASHAETHFGFNIGIGVDVPLGVVALRVNLGLRQISLNGDTFKTVPITLGLRF
jgi:hypothetical protein